MITIREYKPKDEEQISKLFHETVREVNIHDYSPEQVEAWAPDDINFSDWKAFCENRLLFVADHQGTIAGFIDLFPDGKLDFLYCHKNYQRQGVGMMLYKKIEGTARIKNIDCIYTEASITAKPFFIKAGFDVIKEQEVEYNNMIFVNYLMKKYL